MKRRRCCLCEKQRPESAFYPSDVRSGSYRCKDCRRELGARKTVSMTRQVYGLLKRTAEKRHESMSALVELLVRTAAKTEGVR